MTAQEPVTISGVTYMVDRQLSPGKVLVVRGVVYVVTSVRPDGEPCLTRLGDQQ